LNAGATAVAPAWGAEVVSSNIVGYHKINLVKGFNLVAPQFAYVGSDSLTRDISTIGDLKDANGDSMAGYDSEYIYATRMLVWDSTKQDYVNYGWAGTSPEDIDGASYASLNNTWLDMTTEETDDTVDVGQGFWVKADEAGTMTISGEVPSGNNIPAGGLVINLVAGFNMVANPYPMEVPVSTFGQLADSNGNPMAGYDGEYIYATRMMRWDSAKQDYVNYGWAGTSPEDIDGASYANLNNTWLDMTTEATTDKIPAGAAVWIKAGSAGTITFPEL